MTSTGPSTRVARSGEVTTTAISSRRSFSGSSPLISQSSQTRFWSLRARVVDAGAAGTVAGPVRPVFSAVLLIVRLSPNGYPPSGTPAPAPIDFRDGLPLHDLVDRVCCPAAGRPGGAPVAGQPPGTPCLAPPRTGPGRLCRDGVCRGAPQGSRLHHRQ